MLCVRQEGKKKRNAKSTHNPSLLFFFLKRFISFYFTCMSVVTARISVHSRCVTHRGQERESDPLELALQSVVSHYMDVRNQTLSSGRAARVLNH